MEGGSVTFYVSLPAKTPSSWSGFSTTFSSSSLSSSSSSTSSLESSSTPLQISGESQWLLIFTKIGYFDLVDDDPISILDISRLCPGLRNTIQRRSRKTHALFVVLRGKTLTTKMWLLRYNFCQASEISIKPVKAKKLITNFSLSPRIMSTRNTTCGTICGSSSW